MLKFYLRTQAEWNDKAEKQEMLELPPLTIKLIR